MSGIAERWTVVQSRLERACARAGRDPASVRVVAVSKTFGPDAVREAAEAGISIFGENRVQEAKQKIPLCPGNVEWHMVGHLQTNKARDAVRLFSCVHSADSWRILDALNAAAEEAGSGLKVLIEVNVAGEASKFGLRPDDVPGILKRAAELPRLDIVGLMTVPPYAPDPESARRYFRDLRELGERCRDCSSFPLTELSMGMSHDFEVAVEEGATLIRIGTAIFGERRSVHRVEGGGAGYADG